MSKPVITLTPSRLSITASVSDFREILEALDPAQILEVSTTAKNEAMSTASLLKVSGFDVVFDVDDEEVPAAIKTKKDKTPRLKKEMKEKIERCLAHGETGQSTDYIAQQSGTTVEQVEAYLKKRESA